MLLDCTLKTREGGVLAMLGYPRMCHFPGYTFCPKILEQGINFEEKFVKQGYILLGKRPNFVVEDVI